MNTVDTTHLKKATVSKRIWCGVCGFFTGLIAARFLPKVGFYIAMYVLYWPISVWQKSHPEDEMLGWWIVILGYPLNELIYAIAGALLALKIPAIVNYIKKRRA